MNKPKKALKGLFSRTEPAESATKTEILRAEQKVESGVKEIAVESLQPKGRLTENEINVIETKFNKNEITLPSLGTPEPNTTLPSLEISEPNTTLPSLETPEPNTTLPSLETPEPNTTLPSLETPEPNTTLPSMETPEQDIPTADHKRYGASLAQEPETSLAAASEVPTESIVLDGDKGRTSSPISDSEKEPSPENEVKKDKEDEATTDDAINISCQATHEDEMTVKEETHPLSAIELSTQNASSSIDTHSESSNDQLPQVALKETLEPSAVGSHEPVLNKPTESFANESAPMSRQMANAILGIQYNFECHRSERMAWSQNEYLEFIRRIDLAQTEAFFLKGALLEEVKRRFFEDNKNGWKAFAEENLGMNYTTANQYIRVAQEFDVTSHHRPDFGFEHYKALLPLDREIRKELLQQLPSMSVKALRDIVQSKIQKENTSSSRSVNQQGKALVQLLVELKKQIFECDPDNISQKETWQLTAACRNVAEDLKTLAEILSQPRMIPQHLTSKRPQELDASMKVYSAER